MTRLPSPLKTWRLGALIVVLGIALPLANAGASQPRAPRLEAAGARMLGIATVDQAARQLDQAFDEPFEVIVREGPATPQRVADCRALLKLAGPALDAASPADWPALQGQWAICLSLQAIAQVQPARRSGLPARFSGLSATRLWPASVWPNLDEASSKAADSPDQTLSTWLKRSQWRMAGLPKAQGVTATLEDDSVALQLHPLARGDFDGDGLEDWLLLWQAHAKGGSWAATRALLVSRPPGQRALRLTWWPVPPHTDTKSPS